MGAPQNIWTVHIPPAAAEAAKKAGIDVDLFFMKHYGARVEVTKPIPLSDESRKGRQ
jgi:hypothetical protein